MEVVGEGENMEEMVVLMVAVGEEVGCMEIQEDMLIRIHLLGQMLIM